MTRRNAGWIGLCGLASALGCNAQTMIGEDPPTFVVGANSGHTCQPVQVTGDAPFTFPPGVEGIWAASAGPISDALQVTLDEAADGSAQIHIVYGMGTPPPPATSATEYYPPGADPSALPIGQPKLPGVAYLGHNVKWQAYGQAQRVTFGIVGFQPWASWCRLQTSYTDQSGLYYNCAPNTGYYIDDVSNPDGQCYTIRNGQKDSPWPCAQVFLCGPSVCTCDACGCDESSSITDVVDILFDGDVANIGNLRLTRVAN
jgi:hypothetical protein